jgi:hypothetical protein
MPIQRGWLQGLDGDCALALLVYIQRERCQIFFACLLVLESEVYFVLQQGRLDMFFAFVSKKYCVPSFVSKASGVCSFIFHGYNGKTRS